MRFRILREWFRDLLAAYPDDSTRASCHFIGLADTLSDRHLAEMRDYFNALLDERKRRRA